MEMQYEPDLDHIGAEHAVCALRTKVATGAIFASPLPAEHMFVQTKIFQVHQMIYLFYGRRSGQDSLPKSCLSGQPDQAAVLQHRHHPFLVLLQR